jgi:hypothetical protein
MDKRVDEKKERRAKKARRSKEGKRETANNESGFTKSQSNSSTRGSKWSSQSTQGRNANTSRFGATEKEAA